MMTIRIGGLVAGFCLAVTGSSALAETIADPKDGILWQTVRDPLAPIEWRWEGENVTAARLTVVSAMDRLTFAPIVVDRVAGVRSGSATMPGVREAGQEYLYDLTIEFLAGETVVETQTARLVYLPESMIVRAAQSFSRRIVEDVSLYSFNSRWDASTAAAETATVTIQGTDHSTVKNFATASGYGVLAPNELSDLGGSRPLASLAFDGGAAVWSATLRLRRGFLLMLR